MRPIYTLILILLISPAAKCGTVVLTNRTERPVLFALDTGGEKPQAYRIRPDDLLTIPIFKSEPIRFGEQFSKVYSVEPDEIYHFIDKAVQNQNRTKRPATPQLDLVHQPIPTKNGQTSGVSKKGPINLFLDPEKANRIGVVPVYILVDEDEPARTELWQKRLRDRLEKASKVFEKHARLRFQLVGFGSWQSDDRINDFFRSFREFESESPLIPPAALMIGFTSQYDINNNKTKGHLGGTRGPGTSHILIREWSHRVSKTERLEILIHELGHRFGAAHSANPNSVMRPVVGDHRSNGRDFRVGFDPLNTLALSIYSEQLRLRGAKNFRQFTPDSRQKLVDIYAEVARQMPDDPAAPLMTRRMQHVLKRGLGQSEQQLLDVSRLVIRSASLASRSQQEPINTDRMTKDMSQASAKAVSQLPAPLAARGYLIGLGIALNRTDCLRANPILGEIIEQLPAELVSITGPMPTRGGSCDAAEDFGLAIAWTAVRLNQVGDAKRLTAEIAQLRQLATSRQVDPKAVAEGIALAKKILSNPAELKKLGR
jgi:Metallo-peptidase family M12